MCDPISLAIGAVAGTTLYQTTQARKSAKDAAAVQAAAQTDPAAERAKAEAEAAQRANAQLAETNRRRREQGSLMSKGAPSTPDFSMGDPVTDPGASTLSATGVNRGTVARQSSLMSRAAPMMPAGGSAAPAMSYGGGSRRSPTSMAAL